ncbi:MAG: hypothetical protein AAGF71_01170 [Pseudomonadota bacterium]
MKSKGISGSGALRVGLLAVALTALSGCVVTKPIGVVTDVAVGTVKVAGNVVGTAVDVVTRDAQDDMCDLGCPQ